MTSRAWDALITMIRHGSAAPDADPLEAADEAGALISSAVRDLITVVQEADGAARLRATAALIQGITQIVDVLGAAASPDRAGRANVLGVIEILITEVQRLAPAAASATVDPDTETRRAAARVIRRLTTAPAIARTVRRAGSSHPDRVIRDLLAPAR